MSSQGGVEGGDGYTRHDHVPEIGHRDHDEDAPSHSSLPSFPVIVPVAFEKKNQEQEHQRAASLPDYGDPVTHALQVTLCRFKCVSKPWLALCSDLDAHNRSPRAVYGFFFIGENRDGLRFHDLTVGRGPALVDPTLAFLGSYERISVTDGLLLCKCWVSRSEEGKYRYIVCNPATEKWTVLPPIENSDQVNGHCFLDLSKLNGSEHFLGFDTADPSNFGVVVPQILYTGQVGQVAIYSSKTGGWTSMDSRWRFGTIFEEDGEESVFVCGRMHFTSFHSLIVSVHIEGKVWKEIQVPTGHEFGSIGKSQGYLHYWVVDSEFQLSVWVLEDYGTGNWTLKHTVNVLRIEECYNLTFHPDCNLIFVTDGEMTVSYDMDMDSREVQVICRSKGLMDGVPYIPCFAKWTTNG